MSRDLPRAHAWVEHHDEVVRASRLVGVFIEHPRASVGDLRTATATLRRANELLEDQLATRSDERRKGRGAVRGITWV
jgi:hypothetical protein